MVEVIIEVWIFSTLVVWRSAQVGVDTWVLSSSVIESKFNYDEFLMLGNTTPDSGASSLCPKKIALGLGHFQELVC